MRRRSSNGFHSGSITSASAFTRGLSISLDSVSEVYYYPLVIYCPASNFREDNVASTVVVAGVGMIPFAKPGASPPYDEMGTAAARLALQDAGIGYQAVLQA